MIFDGESILAALVFGAIKLVGYFFLARWLGRRYRVGTASTPRYVAVSRVALGALVAWLVHSTLHVYPGLPWYLVLVFLRLVEWLAVFWYFHERPAGTVDGTRLLACGLLGTLVSCLLDAPAFFGAMVAVFGVYGFC
jgi:hypothetical protein